MRTPFQLRGALVAAAIVVAAAGWAIQRAVQRANSAGESVEHTQFVLAQIETVVGLVADADRAVGDLAAGGSEASPVALQRADRESAAAIDQLAALVSDNPQQRTRVDTVRQQSAGTLAVLHTIVRAKAALDPAAHDLGDAENAQLDAMRRVAQDMRLEEDRLLADRVAADQAAVGSLRWLIVALVAVSLALLAGMVWFLARTGAALEARVEARAADLRESSARLQSIIDSAVDAIIVIDVDGCVESANRSTERLFGYTPAELAGQNVSILMPPPDRDAHDGYLARYLATHEPRIIGIGRQVMGRRKDGSTFPLHLSVGEMELRGRRYFTGILHDLTKRVRAEGQLREQASLVHIGEMAAVLAHEIKNPLAGIRGAVEVIAGRLPGGSRDAIVMREVVARIDGLNNLMKDLLIFARPPRAVVAETDLAAIVLATAELLKSDPSLKDMDVSVEGSAAPVDADAEFLKIVFINLLTNASQAMQGSGAIRVTLSASQGMSEAAVRDSGSGIPPDLREKIFTPFFTTKSRGSGLGLATCKRLIEALNGSIALECPAEGGTVVTVRLPSRSAKTERS